MDPSALTNMVSMGEDTRVRFRENVTNPDQLARDMVAFSNCLGGTIIIGITRNGNVKGLSEHDIESIERLISNVAFEYVSPAVLPKIETIIFEGKSILSVEIPIGPSKPYCVSNGAFLTKKGTENKKIPSEELMKMFKEKAKRIADNRLFQYSNTDEIDINLFQDFYQSRYHENFDSPHHIPQLLENLNLASHHRLSLAAILLFCNDPIQHFPLSQIVAVSFHGNDASDFIFRDSDNIEGNILTLFNKGLDFLLRNLQLNEDSNEPEIPEFVLKEILINALIHRSYYMDYLISGNIRISIFDNRVEIENPGNLVDELSIEKMKTGVAIPRNTLLSLYAPHQIPYRGVGQGIVKAMQLYPQIEFTNDIENEQFKVTIYRPTQEEDLNDSNS